MCGFKKKTIALLLDSSREIDKRSSSVTSVKREISYTARGRLGFNGAFNTD